MKLLAVDYDGTLKYGKDVAHEDIQAIHAWRNEGNIFVIDTGRSMQSILSETKKYQIPVDFYITNNGGMTFDHNHKELYSTYLEKIMSLDIIYIAKEVGNVVSYVVNDGFYRHRVIIDHALTEMRYPGLKPDMEESQLMNLDKFAQFVISMTNPSEASILARRINEHFPSKVIAYANKYVVDVVPKDASKASGLEALCIRLNIRKEDVFTMGDADNDIPLILFGDHGACISSAEESVKAYAKEVFPNVAALIHYTLNKNE